MELPPGLYVVNANLLYREGRRVTQIHKTRWDAIIVDEAHHYTDLPDLQPRTLFRNPKTATLLLTATPFQLSPQEIKKVFTLTFGGLDLESARRAGAGLYGSPDFRQYRAALNELFQGGHELSVRTACGLRDSVRATLLPRIVRNPKRDERHYFLVNEDGQPSRRPWNPFVLDDAELGQMLAAPGLIEFEPEVERAYLEARDRVSDAARRGSPTFVAGALRQFLSSWGQFRASSFARTASISTTSAPHPKMEACERLIAGIFQKELPGATRGWIGKALVFTTYVGADQGALAEDHKSYGTSAALKRALEARLRSLCPKPNRKTRLAIKARLLGEADRQAMKLSADERKKLRRALEVFSGSGPAALLLSSPASLRREARELRRLLDAVGESGNANGTELAPETRRRLEERRERRLQQILNRYTTRDLVARYDGATEAEARDRHLHGFNSPFAPLVLIASSVAQEGVDLQKYCRHVIHYDLEWNPAKLEQREGRVDRAGRTADGPVNVYFLLCRGTYDERVMHVMVNRFRWHQVLLSKRGALERAPSGDTEPSISPKVMRRVALDLKP
ncbi:MAG: hypothetical protein AMXMBFR34_41740 [Myxococcaceae bacterium]